ncbi:MAG: hypothetical protein ACK5IM_07495 [Demequina sp.]|uniref:hypothetical protein n=1 Tax=Demequina sp. TaxID=2050685 RepID=UPI003A843DAB
MRATRRVPGSIAETVFPRPFWWCAAVFNAGIVATLAWAAVAAASAVAVMLFAAFACAWAALTAALCVLVLVRPRHSAADLARTTHGAGEPGVTVPGSSRVTATLTAAAAVWTLTLAAVAAVAPAGWAIAAGVGAVAAALAALSTMRGIRPRSLHLTPAGLTSSWSRGSGTLAWDEITDVAFVQGRDGLMCFRLTTPSGTAVVVEPATLDLDPYLILMAIQTYRGVPARRSELADGRPHARLTDPRVVLAEFDGSGPQRFGPEGRR